MSAAPDPEQAAPSPRQADSDSKLTPMMQQFFAVKRAHPDALVFFRMGDFFEMFYDDAVTAAPVLGITLTARGKGAGGDPAPMCGVPVAAHQNYLAPPGQGRFQGGRMRSGRRSPDGTRDRQT